MADSLPNYMVEAQRLRSQIVSQQANIERQKLEIMEMAERKRKHEENIDAAFRAIATYEEQLRGLEQTHGTLTDQVYENMRKSLG